MSAEMRCSHRWEVVGTWATCMDCGTLQPKKEGGVIGPQWEPKTIAFDDTHQTENEPVPGARAVYFLIHGPRGICWEHKGWMMPSVIL